MKVEQVDEADETDDKSQVDDGLDREAEGSAGLGGAFDGEGASGAVEAVGDPLIDCPEEEEEEEAGEPGTDDAAGFDTIGIDVGVEEADSRHEEGAEDGKEDLSARGSVFGRCWQLEVLSPRRYKKMTRSSPGQ